MNRIGSKMGELGSLGGLGQLSLANAFYGLPLRVKVVKGGIGEPPWSVNLGSKEATRCGFEDIIVADKEDSVRSHQKGIVMKVR